jgi:heme-degrading monooxygenase HmoA
MMMVFSEAWPKPEHRQHYLDFGAELDALAAAQDGFVSVERFVSLGEPDKYLALIVFRDMPSLEAWREVLERHVAQVELGHVALLTDYRIRLVEVAHDLGMAEVLQVLGHDAAARHGAAGGQA